MDSYNTYITSAMESLQGTDENVKATNQHVPKPYDGTEDGEFYMAHLDLKGKVVDSERTTIDPKTGEEKDTKYNSIHAYGFRLDRVIEFMKDQGYYLHGIQQFCDADSDPKLSITFCLEAEGIDHKRGWQYA